MGARVRVMALYDTAARTLMSLAYWAAMETFPEFQEPRNTHDADLQHVRKYIKTA